MKTVPTTGTALFMTMPCNVISGNNADNSIRCFVLLQVTLPYADLSTALTCLHSIRAADSPQQKLLILEEGGTQQNSWMQTAAGSKVV